VDLRGAPSKCARTTRSPEDDRDRWGGNLRGRVWPLSAPVRRFATREVWQTLTSIRGTNTLASLRGHELLTTPEIFASARPRSTLGRACSDRRPPHAARHRRSAPPRSFVSINTRVCSARPNREGKEGMAHRCARVARPPRSPHTRGIRGHDPRQGDRRRITAMSDVLEWSRAWPRPETVLIRARRAPARS